MTYRRISGSNILFNNMRLSDYLDDKVRTVLGEAERYDKNTLLNTDTQELAKYFAEQHGVDPVKLLDDQISADQKETKIDVSGDPNRYFSFPGEPHEIDGTEVTVHVPFEGDPLLFQCQASTFTLNPPRGDVSGQTLVLRFEVTEHNAEALKARIDRELGGIRSQLSHIDKDLGNFSANLRQQAANAIDKRKEKLKNDQSLVAGLGFKIRSRDDAPQTFVVPEVKRKLRPPQPSSNTPTELEPVMADKDFNHILKVVTNMVHVIERSPKAFVGMDEEALRNHFLVQLNGQYEGQATGETFNAGGKTDILIRHSDKNIFIAECKFWDGAEVFKGALAQLLSYATWRDGKLALLIFNRNKNLSQVLNQLPDLIEESEHFIAKDSQQNDTEFRFTMSHPNDRDKHLSLAVLVFDVPTELKSGSKI